MKKHYIGIIAFGLSLSASATESHSTYREVGIASYYDDAFDGCVTANGEVFSQNQMTCAHLSLPLGTMVKVTNLKNHLSIILRVNDRGPYIDGRMVDLSKRAAEILGFTEEGLATVRLETVSLKSYLSYLSEDFEAGIRLGYGRTNCMPVQNVAVYNDIMHTPGMNMLADLNRSRYEKVGAYTCQIQSKDKPNYLIFIGIFYRPEKVSAFHEERKPNIPDAEPMRFFDERWHIAG